MAYKNWDEVREERIYSYLNTPEHEKLGQAMQKVGISQKATAVRHFLMAMSDRILSATQAQTQEQIEYSQTDNNSETVTNTVNNTVTTASASDCNNPFMINHINCTDINLTLNLNP